MKIVLQCAEPGVAPQVLAGQGGPVLCSPEKVAVDFATRLYPDRRVEVKASYADPELKPGALNFLLFLAGVKKYTESPEALKARMVACATRLIGVSKSDGEGAFVGGPLMIRLLSFKLVSIGYKGPFLGRVKAGERREFEYQV